LGGWNCRHSFYPYIPGAARAYSSKQLKEYEAKNIEYNGVKMDEYEASQTQRGLERNIRKHKRTVAALEAAGQDASAARKKLREANKAYTDFTDQTGLRKQPARTKIAGIVSKNTHTTIVKQGNNGIIKENSKTQQSGGQTGAKKTAGWQDRHAETYYEEIRNRKPYSDANKIKNNVSGFTSKQIEKIRQHVFIKSQPRDGGMKPFDPDYEQAQVWQRLIDGKNVKKSDKVFLQHELYELTIMEKQGLTYEEAHDITNKIYNWQDAVDKEG
jgi:hypothetical protein